jgi:hypothetical protein
VGIVGSAPERARNEVFRNRSVSNMSYEIP